MDELEDKLYQYDSSNRWSYWSPRWSEIGEASWKESCGIGLLQVIPWGNITHLSECCSTIPYNIVLVHLEWGSEEETFAPTYHCDVRASLIRCTTFPEPLGCIGISSNNIHRIESLCTNHELHNRFSQLDLRGHADCSILVLCWWCNLEEYGWC